MSNRPQLLNGIEHIDTQWLSDVLRKAGFASARVRDFEICPIGAGNVSDTVRVRLEYDGGTVEPASLVCKFSSSLPDNHAHGIGSGSYYREVNSYAILQKEGDCCRTPRLFWIDGGKDNINLVMEDLSAKTRAGDQISGCSVDDAASVIVELAKLHRSFFPLSREDAPEWAMTMADTADYWVAAIERGMPIMREQVFPRLASQDIATIERANELAPRWYRLPVLFGTISHGDPRVDNILFADMPDGPQAILIDWQMTGWRNPMHDVGYFLSGSVSTEDRHLHERTLLELYAETFGRDRGYSMQNIVEDYRLQLLSGLMTTMASYGVLPLNPVTDRLLITLLQRNAAAAISWESLDGIGPLRH